VADEVTTEDTRGSSRGTERKGPQSAQRPEEAREEVDVTAIANFAQELADMAVADPSEGAQTEQESDRGEGFDDDQEVEVEIEKEDMAKARPAREATVLPGGEDDPDDAAPPPTPDAAPAAAPPGSPIPRIRPRARAAWLGLETALEAGLAEAILFGWQARVATSRVEELTTPEWLALVRAMRIARTPIAQALVLKALGANRDPPILPAFASRIREIGEAQAVSLVESRVAGVQNVARGVVNVQQYGVKLAASIIGVEPLVQRG
jgi:hypothetical protein